MSKKSTDRDKQAEKKQVLVRPRSQQSLKILKIRSKHKKGSSCSHHTQKAHSGGGKQSIRTQKHPRHNKSERSSPSLYAKRNKTRENKQTWNQPKPTLFTFFTTLSLGLISQTQTPRLGLIKLLPEHLQHILKCHDPCKPIVFFIHNPDIAHSVSQCLHHYGHQRAPGMANNGLLRPPPHPR